jgi:hypothetical protein
MVERLTPLFGFADRDQWQFVEAAGWCWRPGCPGAAVLPCSCALTCRPTVATSSASSFSAPPSRGATKKVKLEPPTERPATVEGSNTLDLTNLNKLQRALQQQNQLSFPFERKRPFKLALILPEEWGEHFAKEATRLLDPPQADSFTVSKTRVLSKVVRN